MSLSTLLEAAKYLDFLDSNNHMQQQQQQQQQTHNQPQQQFKLQQQQFHYQTAQQIPEPNGNTRVTRRTSRRKNAASDNNNMVAMSLPTTSSATRPVPVNGVPIPMSAHAAEGQLQAASLSSSMTTGSPLSSFASFALLCSKASNVTSASSSAASSLSSSDSSSCCGEIMMGDSDMCQPVASTSKLATVAAAAASYTNNISNNHHNYQLTHHQQQQQQLQQQQQQQQQLSCSIGSAPSANVTRYIAATSAGPQLVTMHRDGSNHHSASSMASSAPIDGRLRAGHVIHAAVSNGAMLGGGAGAADVAFVNNHNTRRRGTRDNIAGSFGSEADHHQLLIGSPHNNSSGPQMMLVGTTARGQHMLLNPLSPGGQQQQQQMMDFQPALASSPTLSSTSSYSRHRELHKTLEKNRRAHLRHCFELLKTELPTNECADKKTSHINIIKSAIRYVLALRQQEKEIEQELQRLTKIKNEFTERLSNLCINDAAASDAPNNAPGNNCNNNNNNNNNNNTKQQPDNDNTKKQPRRSNHTHDPHITDHLYHGSQQPVAEQQLSFLLSQSKID